MAVINSPLSTTNGIINITSGTGTISIAADPVQKTLNLGNSTGNTTVNINAGTNGLIQTATGPISLDAAGIVSLNSSADEIRIGNNAVAQNIQIGTGAAARTITIGNVTGASAVNLNSGTGGIALVSTGSGDIAVNSADQVSIDSVNAMTMNASVGNISIGSNTAAQNINIGTGAAAKVLTLGNTTGATGIVLNVGSAGVSIPTFTTTGAVVSNASGVLSDASASTAGFVLTSNGAGTAPSFQAAGGGGGGLTWSNVTGTSQAAAANTGYIANNASLVTVTLPATAVVGSIVAVQGSGAGGWTIAQNAGQTIRLSSGSSTTGVGGSLSSSTRYDVIYLICIIADTDWAYSSGFGNYNVI